MFVLTLPNLWKGCFAGDVVPMPKPYSVTEYRERQGKGQVVSAEERGGPYRDHSVSVALQLNKVSESEFSSYERRLLKYLSHFFEISF